MNVIKALWKTLTKAPDRRSRLHRQSLWEKFRTELANQKQHNISVYVSDDKYVDLKIEGIPKVGQEIHLSMGDEFCVVQLTKVYESNNSRADYFCRGIVVERFR